MTYKVYDTKATAASCAGSSSTNSPKSPSIFRRFSADESGVVSWLFGFLVFVLMFAAGAAIDFGRWLHARSVTIAAVDAGVLAGARALQTTGLDEVAAMAAAQSFYDANVKNRPKIKSDTINFKVLDSGTAVTAEGSAYIETTFLKLANIDQIPLLKLSGAEYSEAVLSVGNNAEQSLEVSLMLDITGSMSGQKLEDMKAAAKDLIDVVVWDDQGAHTSRVALVPFSAAIKVGDALTGSVTQTGPSSKSVHTRSGYYRTFYRASNCAAERIGPEAYTDAAPNGSNALTNVYTRSGSCDSSQQIVPLTNDKDVLKSTIDGFSATGATAGHLGTAWAWYMLSPNWNGFMPGGSQPAPYSKLSESNSFGKPSLQKVAVLMTDGAYNVQYCSTGVRDRYANGSSYSKGSCTAANGRSRDQARTICAAMKDKGITIYTVGFELPESGDTVDTLQQCATSQDHFYTANNGEELRQSFRDIALKISDIYLSK